MMLNLMYLMMGITVGVIIRYEVDLRSKKKKAEQRIMHLKSTASTPKMQQYDEILNSIKSINQSLSAINQSKSHKKEVR